MGALQPVLTFLLAPSATPMPLSALDLAAIALAVWVGWAGRMAPGRARALLLAGVVVAGLGPLLASAASLVPSGLAGPASGMASWVISDAPGACAVVGLLLLAAGCARLALGPRGSRRLARLLEAFCLVLTTAGVAGALLATRVRDGLSQLAGITLPPTAIATAGWALALAGAAGVVAADASGRASGPVPYMRRLFVVLAAAVYAAVAMAMSTLGAWGMGAPAGAAWLAHLAQAAALLLLAWSVRRVLDRPAAADYWRGEAAASARKRHHVRQGAETRRSSPRIVATPPAGSAAPARHVPEGISWQVARAASIVPFTPPALRRSLLLESAGVPIGRAVLDRGNTMPALELPAAPAGAARALAAPALTFPGDGAGADEDSNQLGPGTLETNLAPGVRLSPQFVAALLHLQAEMLRAGRTYAFEELVALFEEVQPRSSLGPWHTPSRPRMRPLSEPSTAMAQADPPLLPALPVSADDNVPPATPRFRVNIVP